MRPDKEIELISKLGSTKIKSVKNAVNCGPKLNPKAIIRKACMAAV